ncbi:RagB/SusD family nutrient uptake outer membrane protein [Pedobacter frigoris]|uniref:RagB/SusD family nutrient uptake outer membrane protein n=1 Tax=Pedobacter frigoris TaxID=2571272 RepID=UPI00293102DB|nr:RagB/SusD family nutrient uptake outer membrane protein [Pedobacter frigoris]
MKKIHISTYLSCAFLGMAILTSCQKYEAEPLNITKPSDVYDPLDSAGVLLQQRVNNLYSTLPQGFNRLSGTLPLDAATDDAIATLPGQNTELLSKSLLTAGVTNPDEYWKKGYAAIRNANDYFAYENKVPAVVASTTALTIARKEQFKTEVRFIRAMQYFELIKRYGGVPLIGNAIFDDQHPINVPRNTYQECVDYIVSECDALITGNNFPTGAAFVVGRVTKNAVLALKARVLLYAASPLNNVSNDAVKWQAAADASKVLLGAITEANLYSLLEASYNNAFLVRTSKELIFGFHLANNTSLELQLSPVGYVFPGQISTGNVSPTQDLVDAFPNLDGSAYVAGTATQNPYTNRDPRLALTVFYNGLPWLNRPVETFIGGKDNLEGQVGTTRTGYYQRKFLGNLNTALSFSAQTRTWPIFRTAGIMLDYAEAVNEAGNQNDAYAVLKTIRKRAGITAGTNGMYGLAIGMNTSDMRTAIRLERRIELAFEEQRFWDVRRWKIGGVVANKNLTGIRIVKNPDATLTYTRFVADKISFSSDKYNLYPIPFNEILANPAVKQNVGY